MENELGLSEEYLAECKQKRERAERAFEVALDELASTIDLKPEHLKRIKDSTIVLACEALQIIEKLEGPEENGTILCEETGEWIPAENLYDTVYWIQELLREGHFHAVSSPGEPCAILIGQKGEEMCDNDFQAAFESELAHILVRSLGKYRQGEYVLDNGVSEFYDVAMSWKRKSNPLSLMMTMFAHYYLNHEDEFENEPDLCAQKVKELIEDEHDLSALPARFISNLFSRFQSYENKYHLQGRAICWQLALAISETSDTLTCKQGFGRLPDICGKVLYDEAVDFSSPEAFVETVTARLDDYLA